MADRIATLSIPTTPLTPSVGSIFGMALMVRSPRSSSTITVMINPAALDYQDHPVDTPAIQVRQAAVMGITDETITLFFDLHGEYTHVVTVAGAQYEVRLLSIEADTFENQKFPRYEFMVTAI